MDKRTYIENAFEKIRAREFKVPFELDTGVVVTDLEKYLHCLRSGYLVNKEPRVENLFYEKIEYLKNEKLQPLDS